jgi:hypothetical protein
MYFVLWDRSHLRIPFPNELGVFVDLVRLDLVEDDRVDILSAG